MSPVSSLGLIASNCGFQLSLHSLANKRPLAPRPVLVPAAHSPFPGQKDITSRVSETFKRCSSANQLQALSSSGLFRKGTRVKSKLKFSKTKLFF